MSARRTRTTKRPVTEYLLPIEVRPLEEGGYLAACPAIQGCHAEGKTVAEAIENVQDVAKTLLEIFLEDGMPVPEQLHEVKPDTILHNELVVTIG